MSYKKITIVGDFEPDETGLEPKGLAEALMDLGIVDIDITVEETE